MKRPFFFFRQLGYRRNPFGALTEEEWAETAVLPAAVHAALTRTRHLQVLGPAGIGKSTLLLGVSCHFRHNEQRVIYEYLPEGQTAFITALDDVDVFCLDEVQRLNRRERRRLQQAASRVRLILSSHTDLRHLFAAESLTTFNLENLVNDAYWGAALAARLDFFSLPGEARVTLSPGAVTWLWQQFGIDLRAGEYFLYEVWQAQQACQVLTAQDLQAVWQQLAQAT